MPHSARVKFSRLRNVSDAIAWQNDKLHSVKCKYKTIIRRSAYPRASRETLFFHNNQGFIMLYAIIAEDVDDSLPRRAQARPAHLARLEELKNQGRLVLAGPHPALDSEDPGAAGFSGSLIVAEFLSLEDAQTWAFSDPYQAAGVYARVTVKPFKKVLP
jgi:uncharacterized protein